MVTQKRFFQSMGIALCSLLTGCASTTINMTPSPQAPVCDRAASALILWAPQWRPEQKDILQREAAAEAGLHMFIEHSGCFAHAVLQRIPEASPATVSAQTTSASGTLDKLIVIAVRELGPVVKLLSSVTLVEGSTEVLLDISEFSSTQVPLRTFSVHWVNGGSGMVKGVESLPGDMQAALVAGLQSRGAAR
ncbi:MAG: hypothetical protein B7Y40_02515 [Gammaproteobacteria bacterium 28-57-27]|nr:MAG: hypothetical protein B7Y40_02515 [Gammaproteobacteria bacterium 28-57-27]